MKQLSWEKKVGKISPVKKPENFTLEEWQIELRRQIAREGSLRLKNVGGHPLFSTFEVKNKKTGRIYRVVIRGQSPGINYCSCPDFEINTLGTCKHIESVLRFLGRNKENRKLLKKGYVSEHSSVTLRYGSMRQIFFSFGTRAGPELKKLAGRYFDADGYLTPEGFHRFDEFMKLASRLKEDIRYHDDAMVFIARMRDQEIRKKRVEEMFPPGLKDSKWEHLIKTELYPYQREGVLFAAKAGRCLLADDMGLGKTIQAIAAGELMARTLGVERVLVVCPSSLKHQWKQEIEKFTDRPAQVIGGMRPKRQAAYQSDDFFKIVNYDVVHRDLDAIEKWKPDLIILDEAQRIKNWKTRLAKSVKKLSSPYALVLTGTPLENRLEELHSILEFVDRHHLGPLFRFLDRHQITDATGKVTGYRDLHGLGKTLASVLIRRRKHEVLTQLPRRMDKNYFVPMTFEQMEIHEENREIAARIVSKWRRYHFLSEEDQRRLMMALQNMRMVCDNTYLIDKKTIQGKKIDELEIQLREIFEDPKSKAVIFSQWIRMGELVEAMLNVNGWKYAYLHGGVPSNKRGDLLRVFREDSDCRVFLSTDAGGTGLNLQQASTVINLDMPWNPAVLEQRIGRVHRLGQERAVRVINFIAEGTIEHGMLALHRFKHSMFSGVLDGGENEVLMGGSRLSRFMKTVETATSTIPEKDKDEKAIAEEAFEDERTAREEVSEEMETPEKKKVSSTALSEGGAAEVRNFVSLLDTGISWLSQMRKSLENTGSGEGESAGMPGKYIRIGTDSKTGQKHIQIPLPDEKTLAKLAEAASIWMTLLKK